MSDRQTASVPGLLTQWDDWLSTATDRLMQLDQRVTTNAADLPAGVPLDVAAAFVCRKAIAQRIDEIRARPDDAAAASARPLVDDSGQPVAGDLAGAAALLGAVLDKVERDVASVETTNQTIAVDRVTAAGDLDVAERLAGDLGHYVQRCAAARARLDAAGRDANELRAVAVEARALRDELERIAQLRTTTFERWRALPERIDRLREREAEVRALVDTCRAKVLPLPVLAMPSTEALGPVRPVAELEAMTWPSARAAMEPFLLRVDRLGAAFDEVARRFGAVLEQRNDLRGLLHAFRDKAAASGLGESPDLEPLFRTAEQVLWGAPCDVEQAARLVKDYTDAVNAAVATVDRGVGR
ncbi:MAG: hypothetical protein U0Q03_01750 [Acidimicrobiales bacterium]